MDENIKKEKTAHMMLITIAQELGCKTVKKDFMDSWELQDFILKEIHIERILRERDRKKVKTLSRDLDILKQSAFSFIPHMEKYR